MMALRTLSDKISIAKVHANEQSISIKGGNPRCSVVSDSPIVKESNSESKFTMQVAMNVKKLKTALGLMEKGKSYEYMRNDDIGEEFVR